MNGKSHITDYDYTKLLHDMKRVSRLIPILRDITTKKLRHDLAGVLLDELQKMYDDLNEISKDKKNEG